MLASFGGSFLILLLTRTCQPCPVFRFVGCFLWKGQSDFYPRQQIAGGSIHFAVYSQKSWIDTLRKS